MAAAADVFFDDDCIVNVPSIAKFIKSGLKQPKICWHSSVFDELDKFDNWWPVLRANFVARKPERWTLPAFQEWATEKRAGIGNLREKIQSILDGVPGKMHQALSIVENESEIIQIDALAQLAKFSALQLVLFLQRGDNFLPDPAWKSRVSFPTLPRVPEWLVDLEPKRSALGAYVFGEGHFLLARVGEEDQAYESVVLPTRLAERLQESGRDDMAYYRWIILQVHYDFKRTLPSKDRWKVYALRDGKNGESWSANSPRPWRQPQ